MPTVKHSALPATAEERLEFPSLVDYSTAQLRPVDINTSFDFHFSSGERPLLSTKVPHRDFTDSTGLMMLVSVSSSLV